MRPALPLIAGALALGALVRLVSGASVLHTDLVVNGTPAGSRTTNTPESAVVAFYEQLARGDYEEAWTLSLEPVWRRAGEPSYKEAVLASPAPESWLPESRFVARCAEDLGSGLKLNGIQAVPLAAVPENPETRAAAALTNGRLRGVHASGQMLGACLIYRWDRDLVVAEIDGTYKVVLPGTRAAKSLYHESWFSNVELVGSLRAGR
jgi:hypothetical protein